MSLSKEKHGFKLWIMLIVLILVAAFAFGAATSITSQSTWGYLPPTNPSFKYGGTLSYMGGWGPLTQNFSPFAPSTLGIITYQIYETLFYDNPLNGDITPVLGTSYKWEDNNLKLVVTTRQGVKWSDGVPFTANDVAFTFNLIKQYPALDSNGIWSSISELQSVQASGDNTVVFTFSKPNTPMFMYISNQLIIPEHIWSTVKDPVTWNNPDPIGTGPFLFDSFNPNLNEVVIKKNPNYWIPGRPYIDKIAVYSTDSFNYVESSLLAHKFDWGFTYVPDVQKIWADRDPTNNKYWWPVVSTNILLLNTQKYPFTIPQFRQALAMAINKEQCDQAAYFGIGGAANPTGIIPSQQQEWLDPTLTPLASELESYNPQKAQALLASIGFKKNSTGQLCDPNGNPLPTFKILTGAGWGDYMTISQIISNDLKVLGIDTVIDAQVQSLYTTDLMKGTYDMAICWAAGNGPTPYYLYYQSFNPSFSASKIGKIAQSDWSRYTNPLITAALQIYSQTSDIHLQKQAMYTIERIMLEEMPFVPLTNRTNFEVYWTGKFTGFPSASNPYTSGNGLTCPDGRMVSLSVHLK